MKTLFLLLMACALAQAGNVPSSKEIKEAKARLDRQPAVECKAADWPFKRRATDIEMHLLFKKVRRDVLVQYLFGEVTVPRDQLVAYPLVRFLSRTEQNPNLAAFFDLIEASASINDNMGKPKKIELAEICDLYRKTVALPLPVVR